jgi:hypothetical protein
VKADASFEGEIVMKKRKLLRDAFYPDCPLVCTMIEGLLPATK